MFDLVEIGCKNKIMVQRLAPRYLEKKPIPCISHRSKDRIKTLVVNQTKLRIPNAKNLLDLFFLDLNNSTKLHINPVVIPISVIRSKIDILRFKMRAII